MGDVMLDLPDLRKRRGYGQGYQGHYNPAEFELVLIRKLRQSEARTPKARLLDHRLLGRYS